jgi:hypothetical protein
MVAGSITTLVHKSDQTLPSVFGGADVLPRYMTRQEEFEYYMLCKSVEKIRQHTNPTEFQRHERQRKAAEAEALARTASLSSLGLTGSTTRAVASMNHSATTASLHGTRPSSGASYAAGRTQGMTSVMGPPPAASAGARLPVSASMPNLHGTGSRPVSARAAGSTSVMGMAR